MEVDAIVCVDAVFTLNLLTSINSISSNRQDVLNQVFLNKKGIEEMIRINVFYKWFSYFDFFATGTW
jgi:hypothetical protein